MHDYPLLCGLLALLLLSSIAAADVNRVLQAEMNSQSIGSRSYAAEGVRIVEADRCHHIVHDLELPPSYSSI